jgi:hypothetical protein
MTGCSSEAAAMVLSKIAELLEAVAVSTMGGSLKITQFGNRCGVYLVLHGLEQPLNFNFQTPWTIFLTGYLRQTLLHCHTTKPFPMNHKFPLIHPMIQSELRYSTA